MLKVLHYKMERKKGRGRKGGGGKNGGGREKEGEGEGEKGGKGQGEHKAGILREMLEKDNFRHQQNEQSSENSRPVSPGPTDGRLNPTSTLEPTTPVAPTVHPLHPFLVLRAAAAARITSQLLLKLFMATAKGKWEDKTNESVSSYS